jgi:hypothetical protein
MQAILILAHTAPDHVFQLASLLKKRFEIYIHFDRKCPLSAEQIHHMEESGIHWYQEISVHWGSWSIVEATLLLMNKAMENPQISHVHVISGQDWPTVNIDSLYAYYENNFAIHMECYPAKGVKKSGEPIVAWQNCYFHYDRIPRRTLFGKIYHRFSLVFQLLFGINKKRTLGKGWEWYHGSQWMDLPRDAVEYLLDYLEKNPAVKQCFQTGFCSDEFWSQTILWHPPLQPRITGENHRLILWEKKHGSYPAVLDEEDLPRVDPAKHHFCRKVIPGVSDAFRIAMDAKNENNKG